MAFLRACASRSPLYGGKSYVFRDIARPLIKTTNRSFHREGWWLTPLQIAHVASCAIVISTQTFIFHSAKLEKEFQENNLKVEKNEWYG